MANSIATGVAFRDQDVVNSQYSLVNATNGQIGYVAPVGVPATVTQLTSKSTGATINAPCGQITMNNAALANGAVVSFTVTNSSVSAYDIVLVNLAGGATTAGTYSVFVNSMANGTFGVSVYNISAGSLSEALKLNFAVFHVATL